MEIGLQELKEGLKEKGLTQGELHLLDESVLGNYLEELKKEMQAALENNIGGIAADIKEEHLTPTPWLVILRDPHAHIGTGIEVDIIMQEHDTDIVFLTQALEDSSGMYITVMPLEYARIFSVQFSMILAKISTVRRDELMSGSGRPLKRKRLHYSDINRVSVDEEFKKAQIEDEGDEDEEDDED